MNFFQSRTKWYVLGLCAFLSAAAGLKYAKEREKEFLGRLYSRKNFTLLDDRGNIFELAKQKDYILLVFTPDGLPPADVKPMRTFAEHRSKFKDSKIQLVMITRTNREIARNFRDGARFPGILLTDPSGSVGKWLDIWKDPNPVDYWAFTLINNKLDLLWGEASREIPNAAEMFKEITAAVPAVVKK